jgi:hypothetical protein
MRPAGPHGQRLQQPLRVLITAIISHLVLVVKLKTCALARLASCVESRPLSWASVPE